MVPLRVVEQERLGGLGVRVLGVRIVCVKVEAHNL